SPGINTPGRGRSSGFVLYHSGRAVGLDRVDAIVAGGCGGVHLAIADDFTVGGGQREIEGTVLGRQAVVAFIGRRILAHRLDALLGRCLGSVALAGQDHLVIAGPEVEHELFATALEDVIAARGFVSGSWFSGRARTTLVLPGHYIASGS